MVVTLIFQLLAALIIIFFENMCTGKIVREGRRWIGLEKDHVGWSFTYFTEWLGLLEIIFYTLSYVAGAYFFIAIWLGARMIYRVYGIPAIPQGTGQSRGLINIFLIGNLMTLLFSMFNGIFIKFLLRLD